MDRVDFITKYMKRIQWKDISHYEGKPIIMVSPRIIKATKDNQTVAVLDAGYNYDWFVFNDSVPYNDNIETTSFFVLKDWE